MAANLLAALDPARYGSEGSARAHALAAAAGVALRVVPGDDGRLAAWVDLAFGPSWWSSDLAHGRAWIAERDGAIVGVAGFGARGLPWFWLRAYQARRDVGVFGPYGVAAELRATGVGEALLTAAFCSLRAEGYRAAVVPALENPRLAALFVRRTGAVVADEFDFGVARARAVILASGAGSNARNVLERVRAGSVALEVAAIVCNVPEAGAFEVAREFGVEAISVVWDRARETRAQYDARVIEAAAVLGPELVLMLGWMHVVPAAFLARFPQTVNVHPAFLPLDPAADSTLAPDGVEIPALRGAHALRDALRDGVRWVGATVHRVTAQTDRGEVLVRVPVAAGDALDEATLRERVRSAEFGAVAAGLTRWALERASTSSA